jgi:hypothetical protein
MTDLRNELENLKEDARRYFATAIAALGQAGHDFGFFSYSGPDQWDILPEPVKQTGTELKKRIVMVGAHIIEAAGVSPLLNATDMAQIRVRLREMTASLRFREFERSAAYAITEEDRVYGMIPEEQRETPTHVETAVQKYQKASDDLLDKLLFILPTKEDLPRAIVASEVAGVRKYRPNTAFIMMRIDDENPRLEDVKNCIKEVFRGFGIEAVRSDEIEHQDVLTQRILDEIATSEFLIADLTGERPSVYYEVGFAHAVGKRPILYREKGTKLHFDLSVHNVPEYENITDLKGKLTKRLEVLTNKPGADDSTQRLASPNASSAGGRSS